MENLSTITTFLGWCTLINIGLLTFTYIMTIAFNTPVKKIHNKILGISYEKLDEIYVNFIANYKLAVLIFNMVPYFALKIMA